MGNKVQKCPECGEMAMQWDADAEAARCQHCGEVHPMWRTPFIRATAKDARPSLFEQNGIAPSNRSGTHAASD